ncbi:MAG: hypothetical protein ACI4D6_06385 [Chordicoccus sp.]
MHYCNRLYIGKSAQRYEKRIRARLDAGKTDTGHYLITLASNGTDMLDIIGTGFLVQSPLARLPMIVGIARTKKEAINMVVQMVDDCLASRGDCDLRAFFESAGGQ